MKRKLYHYTNLEAFKSIWKSQELRFSSVLDVNDLTEHDRYCEIKKPNQLLLMPAYHDIRKSYKQISFTLDYSVQLKGWMSPMMWGVYGKSGNGVCIEFDFEKINIDENIISKEIIYEETLKKTFTLPITAQSIKDIRKFVCENKEDIFFTKHISWQEEKELRLISNITENLDVSNAITAVYLQKNDGDICLQIEELVSNKIPVRCVRFIDSQGYAIPTYVDTKISREQEKKAAEDPNNVLIRLYEKSRKLYAFLKHDENASLLIDTSKIS